MKKKNLFLSLVLSSTMVCSMQSVVNISAQETYMPGVTVEENTNPDWNADYMATFVYEDTDARDAVSVNIQGGFQFYKDEEVKDYRRTEEVAREALRLATHKLPCKCKVVSRADLEGGDNSEN